MPARGNPSRPTTPTLTAAHWLAVDLSHLGDHEQARALAEDTLARHRRTLGPDHPAQGGDLD
jgi:hypothetical protein